MTLVDHEHPIDPERVAHARRRLPNADDAARLTGLLSLMADPVRLRLIYALDVVEELCVGDLALALDVSEDSVTYALRLLRTAGLVRTRKEGRVVLTTSPTTSPPPCATTAYANSSPSPTPAPTRTEPRPALRGTRRIVSDLVSGLPPDTANGNGADVGLSCPPGRRTRQSSSALPPGQPPTRMA